MTKLVRNGRNMGSGVKMICIQILVLPFAGWTHLDSYLTSLSLGFGENKMYLIELLRLKIHHIKHIVSALKWLWISS